MTNTHLGQVSLKSLKNNQLYKPMNQFSEHCQSCPECPRKDSIINKYTHLITLLKKKYQKNQDSKIKDNTASIISVDNHFVRDVLRGQKVSHMLQKFIARRIGQAFNRIGVKSDEKIKGVQRYLSFFDLKMNSKEGKQGRQTLGVLKKEQKLEVKSEKVVQYSSMTAFQPQFLEELFKFKNVDSSLPKKIYSLTLANQHLEQKLNQVQLQLTQNQRRQEKEINKKRISLQGLADELSQKNDLIDELRENIRGLEQRLRERGDIMMNRMLEEDGDSMRRTLSKMQAVNDKLNFDISKLKDQKHEIEMKNKQLSKNNDSLHSQIKQLKEQIFAYQTSKQQTNLLKRQLQLMSQKMSSKMDKIKRMEKRFNQLSKVRDSLSTAQSQRKVQIQTTNLLQRSVEVDMENKLEHLFTYLFHIQEQGYPLGQSELFDEEEKELLITHKQRFINLKETKDEVVLPIPISHNHEQLQKSMALFGESVLDVLSSQPQQKQNNLKLIEFQIERTKLIEKIMELKEKHLHLRSVISQFMKSLDLRNMRKDTEGIVNVLCQYFEYSEEERSIILQPKNQTRKFFGIL